MDLTALERLRTPDLRDEVERRHGSPGPQRAVPEPPRYGRRIAAGVLALLIFVTGAAFVARAFRTTPEPTTPTPWSRFGAGWTELPPPPEWRSGAAIVWADEELLYLGGTAGDDASPEADGFAFDPSAGTWRSLPPAPSGFAWAEDAIWTGTEAVVVEAQGTDETDLAPLAYDPSTGDWRTLPPLPGGGSPATWVWTGHELLALGGGDPDAPSATRAWALDPSSVTWRALPTMPEPVNLANASWTGTEAIVVGSALDRGNRARTRTSIAMAYDPAEDRWTRLPDPPVSSQTADVDVVGDRIIAWELYSPAAAVYLSAEGRWRSIETGPMGGYECYAQGVAVAERIVSWNCGYPGVLDPSTSIVVPEPSPVDLGPDAIAFSQGRTFGAGRVAIVEQIETRRVQGDTQVGFPGAPMHLFVWRPSDAAPEPWVPTADDAENLVGAFLADWTPGWEAYLTSDATADVIERLGSGTDGLPALQGFGYRTWNSFRGRVTAPGVYEVRIELLRDGAVAATLFFTVGPGTTADGRDGVLVITDVRAG